MMAITLEKLQHCVANAAAIRRVRRLQPVGGRGDKIFPPTYPGEGRGRNVPPRHVFETRRIDGQNVLCVLIDSVQSQANRLEEALRIAKDAGAVTFPAMTVDFSKTEITDIGRITTLDAPHRVFDAIIRDSNLDGVAFRETEPGRRLVEAKAQNARAVYELSPTALIFGAWNSTGEGGGLGAKFPRAVVSEIVGVGVATERHLDTQTGELGDRPSGQRTGSRIDPLGIRRSVAVYRLPNGDWSVDPPTPKAKPLRPSEINHSNIAPSVTSLGVSIDYALHSVVLSFAALRRLHFGRPSTDILGQSALAALALTAVTAQDRSGYFLRSRCDLVPEEISTQEFELIDANGRAEKFELEFSQASLLTGEAANAARDAGVGWNGADLLLTPQERLVQLVQQSRRLALVGEAEPDSEDSAS
jgi:CRISPR-associated protein Csb1